MKCQIQFGCRGKVGKQILLPSRPVHKFAAVGVAIDLRPKEAELHRVAPFVFALEQPARSDLSLRLPRLGAKALLQAQNWIY